MKKYTIQCRETGDAIEDCDTLLEAKKVLADYEKSDKKEGIYVENFYEIYDNEFEKAV